RLMIGIDGYGDRHHEAVRRAFETLRPVAWALHVAFRDFESAHHLAPMEALWWTEEETGETAGPPCWRVFVGESIDVPLETVEQLVRDLPMTRTLPAGRMVEVGVLDEGPAVQTLHLGPLEDIAAPEEMVREFIRTHRPAPNG